jgi:hypothetical protein
MISLKEAELSFNNSFGKRPGQKVTHLGDILRFQVTQWAEVKEIKRA